MRKRSKLSEFMRQGLIESSRRLTPEQRLKACLNLSMAVAEMHRAGEAFRNHLKVPETK
jgi:hypothetical protein